MHFFLRYLGPFFKAYPVDEKVLVYSTVLASVFVLAFAASNPATAAIAIGSLVVIDIGINVIKKLSQYYENKILEKQRNNFPIPRIAKLAV